MTELKVGIVGAGGYTGAELVRLVHQHPRLRLTWVAGNSTAGKRLGDVLPSTAGVPGIGDLVIQSFSPDDAEQVAAQIDVAFSCLPHATSAEVCGALFRAGLRVVDLSADFRLDSLETYEDWYGNHPCPELLLRAVYGLPELHREELAAGEGARLIASPGCYPTSAILPLAPLLKAGLIEPSGIIIDSKSGVSGAGRSPKPSTHLPEAAEGMRPYKIAGTHRHTPEIEQELTKVAGAEVRVVFSPQLAPMSRGILTMAYGRARPGTTVAACRGAARELYATGLVTVLEDRLPDTLWVRGSARAHVAYAVDERTGTVLAMAAEDNLSRGSSAQALQAFNVAMGWPEELGLPQVAQFP